MDYETGKNFETVFARLQALEEKLLPTEEETEKEEQVEPPLGKSKDAKSIDRQRKVKRQMEQMKYKDLKDKSAVELSPEEEIVTEEGDVIEEEEDGIELLNQ